MRKFEDLQNGHWKLQDNQQWITRFAMQNNHHSMQYNLKLPREVTLEGREEGKAFGTAL
jgi:hypothetical protein